MFSFSHTINPFIKFIKYKENRNKIHVHSLVHYPIPIKQTRKSTFDIGPWSTKSNKHQNCISETFFSKIYIYLYICVFFSYYHFQFVLCVLDEFLLLVQWFHFIFLERITCTYICLTNFLRWHSLSNAVVVSCFL